MEEGAKEAESNSLTFDVKFEVKTEEAVPRAASVYDAKTNYRTLPCDGSVIMRTAQLSDVAEEALCECCSR